MRRLVTLLLILIQQLRLFHCADSPPPQLVAALRQCDQTSPLGMITGQIADWQITASSVYPVEWDAKCAEKYARVYQPDRLGWCAKYKSASEWLQVDLGVASKVTGFLTQGRGDGQEWVSAFMVSYSLDAFHWQYVTDVYGNQRTFEGNTDSDSVLHSYVDEPFIARFIKFHTVAWSGHPSMRVEVIGCQVCNEPIALPPYGKISASSERSRRRGQSSCHAEDGYVITNKAWCARRDDTHQWLQFDVGPATLVTGLVTRGRGDGRKKHWVTSFRLSYSNDSSVWHFYKDASHLDVKEFVGNVDADEQRYQYLASPITARFIRFHPLQWHRHVSMRAGLLGCPYRGSCDAGFMRVNDFTPCVENVAYGKESWINNRRQMKRHVRSQWLHGHAGRAVDGHAPGTSAAAAGLTSCTVLDNFYVERPVWMVDVGYRAKIAGVLILTWRHTDGRTVNYSDYMYNLDKLVVHADNVAGGGPLDDTTTCGFISRLNDALFKPRLHVQCRRPLKARYVYVEAWGVANRVSRMFSAVLCEVMIYE